VTDAELRQAYLAWTRRAVLALLAPLALTALLQLCAASAWWEQPSPSAGAMRYLFITVGIAAILMGRTARGSKTGVRPLDMGAIRSLSWRLIIYTLAPAVIGAVLAFMTRELGDYYLMLVVTLVGLVLLYPRFDQWAAWSVPAAPDCAEPDAEATTTPAEPER
jgi:hypothetical protein